MQPDERKEIRRKEINFFTSVVVDNVCRALRNGYPNAIVELKQLLLKGKVTPKSVDEHGCSVLHAACQGGLLDVVVDLYQKGFGFEDDREGNSPLHVAYLFNHQGLTEWLISRGQNQLAENKDGIKAKDMTRENVRKAIFAACLQDRSDSVISAVGKGWISVTDQDEQGRTLLHHASANGDRALAAKLVALNSDVNSADADGCHPLHLAMACGCVEVAEFLVDRGADTQSRDLAQRTPWDLILAWSAGPRAPAHPHGGPAGMASTAAPPHTEGAEERLRRAAQMYCRATRRFVDPAASQEITALRLQFDEHCALGTQGLGVENVRTGRAGQASRDQTMDYLEFYQAPPARGAPTARSRSRFPPAGIYSRCDRDRRCRRPPPPLLSPTSPRRRRAHAAPGGLSAAWLGGVRVGGGGGGGCAAAQGPAPAPPGVGGPAVQGHDPRRLQEGGPAVCAVADDFSRRLACPCW